ncbi:MAG: DEAD/DEAH box helicase [Gammaproteobacteria bacterium]|nr:DEAD/DEAH box helicase [Gammaproteobacteria bacterium]
MTNSASTTRFSELALSAPVLQAVEEVGYEMPTPIQAQSIPPLLQGRDLLGMAQTGTGKTAAFALPLLSRLDLSNKQPQILVLTPTRELAIQVAEAMQTYARHLDGFRILPVYGGQGMDVQLRQLKRGVQVVVGTPGRIQDHLRRGTLKLDRLTALVLDEADEMLRMGFIDDVEQILQHTPANKQVALFSATMPEAIKRVARNHLRDPVEIQIHSKTTTLATTQQRYWQVTGVHKLDALTRILEVEEFDGMIIFVRTKNVTVELAEKLEARGYSAAALNGDMNQQAREKTVERLKKGALDILVATDVAARGLDVERISHVLNYDIPHDTESYVHRIGRTGRAGRKGEAILFISPRERRMLFAIEKATGQKITPMQLPSREAVTDKRVVQFKQQISDAIESQDLSFFEQLVEAYQAEHDTGPGEVAAALAYLLQRERPLIPVAEPIREDKPVRTLAVNHDRKRERATKSARSGDEDMLTYRIEVGREHGAQPKNIVGAIANEAGIDSAQIGHIKLHDAFSTVDLPEGMPNEVFQHLRKVWVCGRQLNIHLASDSRESRGKKFTKPFKPSTVKPAKTKKPLRSKPAQRHE